MEYFKPEQLYEVIGTASSAVDSGWIDAADFCEKSLHIKMTSTGTVQVFGSNEDKKMGSSDTGVQIGSNITASSIKSTPTDLPEFIRWLRIKITANGDTISIYLAGARKRRLGRLA